MMDIDRSTWQEKARSKDNGGSLIRPKERQSLSNRETADDDTN